MKNTKDPLIFFLILSLTTWKEYIVQLDFWSKPRAQAIMLNEHPWL